MSKTVGDHPPGQEMNGSGVGRDWINLVTADDDQAWLAKTRVVLSPIAAPSIMGLFGFMIATLMVGAWQAGWYGGSGTPAILWPLALVAGGLLQIIAAIACLRARDGVALAVHAVWGAFWIGWSTLQLLVVTGIMPPVALGTANPGLAFWFLGLGLVTASAALAATATNGLLFATLGTLTAGSGLTAAGFFAGNLSITEAGGWLFVASALAAWLLGTGMMMEHSFGRVIIPLGKWSKDANVPGRAPTTPIQHATGMPGVRVGQ
jgi:hypothetical protein